jgi:hypothetical protein
MSDVQPVSTPSPTRRSYDAADATIFLGQETSSAALGQHAFLPVGFHNLSGASVPVAPLSTAR